MPVNDCL